MIIEKNVWNEIVINKSKFITYLFKIKNKEEFEIYKEKLSKEYKEATHICYAYILNNDIKYNDDKEPQGTAGLPILEVLKKNHLNYIACFVIRYFGGIKLGSGGLTRAYSNSCSLALKKTAILPLKKLIKIELEISYDKNSLIENLIEKNQIIEKKFKENIIYLLSIDLEQKEKLDSYNLKYKIIDTNYF